MADTPARSRTRDPHIEKSIQKVADEIADLPALYLNGREYRATDILLAGIRSVAPGSDAVGTTERVMRQLASRILGMTAEERRGLQAMVSERDGRLRDVLRDLATASRRIARLEAQSRFTAKQVRYMETLLGHGLTLPEVAALYGVEPGTIRAAMRQARRGGSPRRALDL